MKNFLRQGFAKKAIAFAFFVGLVSPSALASQFTASPNGLTAVTGSSNQLLVAAASDTSPVINNLQVVSATGSAQVSFNLAVRGNYTSATTSVWILNSQGSLVKTVAYNAQLNPGLAQYTWDGTNANLDRLPSGSYTAQVVAVNGGGSSDVQNYTFNYVAAGTTQAPVVTVSATPTTFDPNQGQSTNITYSLNQTANLSVEVKLNGSTIRTLRALASQNAGSYSVAWDGYNENGVKMTANTYTVTVHAVNTSNALEGNASTTVTIQNNGSTTAPVLSSVYATPTPFNPNNTNTSVYFTLDKAANVTVSIMNGSTTVKTLYSGTCTSSDSNGNCVNFSNQAGTYYYQWNGRDGSGNVVSNGTYTAKVVASNNVGSDTETTTVQVNTDGGSTSCNVVSSNYVNPSSFNPNNGSAQITYVLNNSATVTVRIKTSSASSDSNVVKTLVDHQFLSSGTRTTYWDGRDSSGNLVSNRSYYYVITASVSGCADDVENGSVTVTNSTDNGNYESDWSSTDEGLITNLTVDPSVFQPLDGERATVSFYLNTSAKLRVEILDGTRLVRSLRNTGTSKQSSGTYSYTWDGRDTNGNLSPDRVYQVRVMADSGSDTDTDRASVELDTDGNIIGVPSGERCAGFKDVSVSSPFCKAIELMSKKHIFDGYSDGTFRPYEKINRAETAKVVTLALGYTIDNTGYFGRLYPDTVAGAWYIPYLKVAQKYDIATGYPDGTFRPGNTINRVELLRVFLEANHLNLSDCSSQPYDDTPVNSSTQWYMRYACFAKNNGLMGSEYSNKLYPADAMTRGDVAQLFYDFEVKGLYGNYNGVHQYDYAFLNTSGSCLSYDNNGNCLTYSNNNSNSHTCISYDSNGFCTNYSNSNSSSYCTSYDSNGNCLNYSTSNNNSYCTSYDSNGNCISYSNNNNSNSNGYYVYRNGQYVWVSY